MRVSPLFVSIALAAAAALRPTAGASVCSSNDLVTLNYALTLEHLESTFYNEFQTKYTAADFTAAGYDQYAYPNLELIRQHEAAHVAALNATIVGRGGEAVPACVYNFSVVTSVAAYIQVAAVLELTGVDAYDGAVNTLTDAGLKQTAATIATVEARHAAYLQQLLKRSPFPTTTDNATLPDAILAIVAGTGFITSCPYELSGPAVLRPTAEPAAVAALLQTAGTSDAPGQQTLTADESANDLKTLQFALTLEHFESAFYNQFQARFVAADFAAAGFGNDTYDAFNLIKAHEQAHVAALSALITAVGGSPVPPCTYNFTSIDSVKTYVAVAKTLENTGVEAYDGAINTIADTNVQQLAASIATVEARHAAFLNELNNVVPFPSVFDTALTPSAIIAAVLSTGLLTACPYEFDLPAVHVDDCSGLPVCPATDFSSSLARTASGLTVSFVNENSDETIAWVDLHVSINSAVEEVDGVLQPQYNYRMAATAQSSTFTYTFPGADGVAVPSGSSLGYFFTYRAVDADGNKTDCNSPVVAPTYSAADKAARAASNPGVRAVPGSIAAVVLAVYVLSLLA